MKSYILNPVFVTIMYIVISYSINGELYSQNIYGIQDQIGGSGSGGTSVQQSDDTMLYILGGAVIAGIVVYALMRDKKEKPKNDSDSVNLKVDIPVQQLILNDDIQKWQPQIPINILIGLQNDSIRKDTKRYFVGLAYNF